MEAPGGAAGLARALPVVGEMPACDLPVTAQDCLYPALAWQARAARVALVRVLQAAPWLKVSMYCWTAMKGLVSGACC